MFKWYLSVSDLFIEGLGLSFYGSYSDVDNNSTDTKTIQLAGRMGAKRFHQFRRKIALTTPYQ